jgi:hypothetical protein
MRNLVRKTHEEKRVQYDGLNKLYLGNFSP